MIQSSVIRFWKLSTTLNNQLRVPTNHTRVRVGVTCIHFNKWVNYMVLGRLAVYSSTVISTCLFQEPLNCQNKRGKNTKLKQRQYVCDKFKM